MADRRTEQTPATQPDRERQAGGAARGGRSREGRPPLSDRVSAAVAAGGASTERRSGTSTAGDPEGRASSSASSKRRGPRKARLRLTHIDPWSVMKTSFLLSLAIGIVTVVSVALVWAVLGAAGVWESINSTVADVVGGDSGTSFDVENYIGTGRVMGFTLIVAAVDVVLITAIATLAAFLYNLAAALLGGVEVTLAEDDR